MAYSEELAARIDAHIGDREGIREQKMFGGIAWMLNGNMAVGVLGDELLVRLGDEDGPAALSEPGTRAFDFTGREMKSIVMVSPTRDNLAGWIDRGLAYATSLPPK